jgi:hypothetical protein
VQPLRPVTDEIAAFHESLADLGGVVVPDDVADRHIDEVLDMLESDPSEDWDDLVHSTSPLSQQRSRHLESVRVIGVENAHVMSEDNDLRAFRSWYIAHGGEVVDRGILLEGLRAQIDDC